MAVVNRLSSTKESPVCSICIANYNGEKYIASCIESVAGQKTTFPFEIIVHDDASTDASVSTVKNFFPYVLLLESRNNVGFCKSNNRMVKEAKGRYILLLNNDAVLLENALQKFYEETISNNEAILTLPQYDAEKRTLIDMGCLFDLFLNPIPNLNPHNNDVGMVIGACLWIPKSLWLQIGGFPEWFGSLAEDMYVCCVARLHGTSIKVLPNSGYLHWVGKSFGGGKVVNDSLITTLTRRSISERNKTYVMAICYPFPIVFFVLPTHILLLFCEGFYLSLLKLRMEILQKIYLNVVVCLFRNLPMILSMRKTVQEKRKISIRKYFSTTQLIPHKLKMLFKYGVPSIN